ncbi:Crp/Fnr family transcriptional regulator [Vibrio amylolyticus]|uniref:Crp/Fnr family transcriptional regulator n=1 Tax=Vibrio amylolyticus TaxID=2847292 RepID=UPI00355023A4
MKNTNEQLLLNTFSQLVPFSQEDMALALPFFTFQDYLPKEYIFSSNEVVADVHFVLDGVGRYFYIDEDGNERNKSLVRKGGAYASISSLVEGNSSPFFAQAITQTRVASVNYDHLVELSRINAQWGDFVRKMFERLVLKKEKREAGFLMLSAKERYQHFLIEFGDDSLHIPLRHVAMYLGITDVTLSRVRREMGLT